MSEHTEHTERTAIIARPEPSGPVLHPIVQAAIERGATAAELREFLQLQREWQGDEAKRAFTHAFAALKRDLPAAIARDTTVDYATAKGGRKLFRHTSLSRLISDVTPHLAARGFSLNWTTDVQGAGEQADVAVTCVLTHAGGHSIATTSHAPPDMSGSKSVAQGIASTMTLLERYTAQALLGVATVDMLEPSGERDPDAVNTQRNQRILSAAIERHWTRAQAEAVVDRDAAAWTNAEADRVEAALKARGGA